MTVAASILLAALVGGVVFVLLDSWQRRADATPEPHTEPLPQWTPRAPHGAAAGTGATTIRRRSRASGQAGAASPNRPSSTRMADSGDVAPRVAA